MMLIPILRPGRSLRTSIHATAVPRGRLRARVSSVSASELMTSGRILGIEDAIVPLIGWDRIIGIKP